MTQQSLTTDQAAQLALERYLQGNWAEGEAICRKILEVDPNHFEAMHLLGLIAHRVGRNDIAVELLQRAAQPASPMCPTTRRSPRPSIAQRVIAAFRELLRRTRLAQPTTTWASFALPVGTGAIGNGRRRSRSELCVGFNNLGNLTRRRRIPESIDAHVTPEPHRPILVSQ
jgi:hypothetical protein